MEQKVAEMYRAIGQFDHAKQFEDFAQKRKLRMDKYMLNKENGLYCNYNFQGKYFSSVVCTASFYPYAMGLTKDVAPLKALLEKLELEYGVSTCEYRGEQEYLQWDYPLMWAPEMYFAYQALKNTGLIDDAKRIANKYLQTVERNYQQTGILWEKYNAKTGEVGSAKESEKHPMLGWTAAIYQYFYKELNA